MLAGIRMESPLAQIERLEGRAMPEAQVTTIPTVYARTQVCDTCERCGAAVECECADPDCRDGKHAEGTGTYPTMQSAFTDAHHHATRHERTMHGPAA